MIEPKPLKNKLIKVASYKKEAYFADGKGNIIQKDFDGRTKVFRKEHIECAVAWFKQQMKEKNCNCIVADELIDLAFPDIIKKEEEDV